jgi:hypothetical protein
MTVPPRFGMVAAVALGATGALLATIPALHTQPLATPEQHELAQARENAKWEQAMA